MQHKTCYDFQSNSSLEWSLMWQATECNSVILLCNSWKACYISSSLFIACWNHCRPHQSVLRTPRLLTLPLKRFQATLICGYSSQWATCEVKVTEYGENSEILALLFMCSVSLSCAIFCSPSAARPALRQARAPSSHSAALAGVLHLTLAHQDALCRRAASRTVPPVARQRIITEKHTHSHTHIWY